MPDFPALVISLDFELHWGMRDLGWGPDTRAQLIGARAAVPRMLQLFETHQVAATWATVGFLFAETRDEMLALQPEVRPDYANPALLPYEERIGENEEEDPYHFAPSLVRTIGSYPGQEIGTHTFSHYYCLDPGHDRESFRADLTSAVEIARRRSVQLRSICFPRNQHNPLFEDVLLELGLTCYRGNRESWMYRPSPWSTYTSPHRRAGRLLDAYVPLSRSRSQQWDTLQGSRGLCNVRASAYLRPYSPRLRRFDLRRLGRIAAELEATAIQRGVYHLWWHPEDFGTYTEKNLDCLQEVLGVFTKMRDKYGMQSMSMSEVCD